MNDILQDIEKLSEALVLIEEGASDERRSGIRMIKNIIKRKKREVKAFEDYYETNDFEPERIHGSYIK